MKAATCNNSSFLRHHYERFRSQVAQIGLPRLREDLKEDRIIIRFENSYGVTIKAISRDGKDGIFEMLILWFHGPGFNDYRTAQYAPLPEYTRGSWDEIVSLCGKVALFPKVGRPLSPEE